MSYKDKKAQKQTKYQPKTYQNYASSEDERKISFSNTGNGNKKRKQSSNLHKQSFNQQSIFYNEHMNQDLQSQQPFQNFGNKSYFNNNNNSSNNNSQNFNMNYYNQNNNNNCNYNSNYESDYSNSYQPVNYQSDLYENISINSEVFLKDIHIQCNGEMVYSNGEYSDCKTTFTKSYSSNQSDSGQNNSSNNIGIYNKNFAGAVFQAVPNVTEIGSPSFL